MSRKERAAAGAQRIEALLAAGDHRAAGAAARDVLGDPASADDARSAAAAALSSLAPERGAVLAGVLGLAVAVALTVLVLVRG